ncbi:MAG: hypothetical protein LCH31_05825 [Actinobacteria bacterium]|nr:hypothetical protein [Actinomycetota bacterium]
MRAAVITPELVQRNLQRIVKESSMRTEAIAVVAQVPHPTLVRKLAQSDCAFSVREVASITMALGYRIEVVFEEQPDMRPCPNESCVEAEHEWANSAQFNPCRLQAIESDGSVVHGHLLEAGWVAWADADDLADGHEGIKQAKALAEAFETMQAACDQLNERGGNGDRSA